MRKRWGVILWSSVALIVTACVCFWGYYTRYPVTPQPSCPGGYYDEAFTLTLKTNPGATIYYTTDGSTPDETSRVYSDGITICDRSSEPNEYNAIRNVVKDWYNYYPPEDPVPKGTVVRAVAVNSYGYTSEVLTQTYFVGLTTPSNAYTLSLVFEKDDLFGPDGIYVTGAQYDAWYTSETREGPEPMPNYRFSNEVRVTAEFLYNDKSVFDQEVGLRIQGASNRHVAKKRFILESREEYSGSKFFDRKLFGDTQTHSVMLKEYTLDALVADIAKDRDVSAQDRQVALVYLNGEFWYYTYMLERFDKTYFREHYQIENSILVKSGETPEDANWEGETYEEFLKWVQESDFSDPVLWAQLNQKVDIQSYIDFIVFNYYLVNCDVCESKNFLLWRSEKKNPLSEYEDMRWRWCLYDMDAISFAQYQIPNTVYVEAANTFSDEAPFRINTHILYRAFYPNPEFRKQFAISFMDIVNNNFAVENMEKILHSIGYDIYWMDGFFIKRPQYAFQHLKEEFELQGELETVTVTTTDVAGGKVIVNTSQLDLSDGLWEGQYFTDYPITVTAVANRGYRFAGWRGTTDSKEATLTLPVDGGVMLEAVFVEA